MAWYFQDPFPNGTGSGVGIFWATSQATTGASLTTQSGAGRWNTGSVASYNGHVTAWASQIGQIGDTEFLLKFRFSDAIDSALELWARSVESSSFTGDTGYIFALTRSGGGYGFTTAASFSYNNIGSFVTQTFTDNQYYWARVRVLGTSTRTLQARVWQDGSPEPGTWNLNFTDSTAGIGSTGYVQINTNGGGSAGALIDIDYIGIGDAVTSIEGTGYNLSRRRLKAVSYPASSVSGIGQPRTVTRPSPRRRKMGHTTVPRRYQFSRQIPSIEDLFPPPPNDYTVDQTDDQFIQDLVAFDLGKVFSDSAGGTDSVLIEVVRGVSPADNAGSTDSTTVSIGRNLAPTDSAGLSDAVTTQGAYVRTQTDDAGLTDALTTALGRNLAQVDSAGTTDSVSSSIGRGIAQVDSAGTTDAAALAVARSSIVSDDSGSSDSISISLVRNLAPVDLAGSTDSALAALARSVTATDTAGATDALTLSRGLGQEDSAGSTDSFSASSARGAAFADEAGSSDSILISIGRAFAPIDSAGSSDSILIDTGNAVFPVDNAGSTDSVTFALRRELVISDDTGTTDALTWAAQYILTLIDSSGSSDVAIVDSGGAGRDIVVQVSVGDRRLSVIMSDRGIATEVADRAIEGSVGTQPEFITIGPRHWSVTVEEHNG